MARQTSGAPGRSTERSSADRWSRLPAIAPANRRNSARNCMPSERTSRNWGSFPAALWSARVFSARSNDTMGDRGRGRVYKFRARGCKTARPDHHRETATIDPRAKLLHDALSRISRGNKTAATPSTFTVTSIARTGQGDVICLRSSRAPCGDISACYTF